MNKMLNLKTLINQKGQVILFVIVSMTLAMAVGVTVASRTLSSLSRTSRSDSSNKALAAAEAGAERFLVMDFSELGTYVGNETPTTLSFVDEVSGVNTEADVTVADFTQNSPSGDYDFNLGTGYVKEVTFKDSGFNNSVTFCWENSNSAIAYLIYNATGIKEKGVMTPSSNNSLDVSNGDVASSSGSYPGGCKTVSITAADYGLRLRALYNDTNVSVQSPADLPVQGYKITSVGKLFAEGKIVTTKKVTVYKSKPYFPSAFDAAIYTEQDFN
jgi:hypothetical protein